MGSFNPYCFEIVARQAAPQSVMSCCLIQQYFISLHLKYFDLLNSEYEINLAKELASFSKVIKKAAEEFEPSILARYLIDLSKAYSSFYNENKIIVEDKEVQDARVYLAYAVGQVLKNGANLLGIEMPNKM